MPSEYQLASGQLQSIPKELDAVSANYSPDAQVGTIWWISNGSMISVYVNSMPFGQFQEIVKLDKDRFVTAQRVANSLWKYKKYSDLYLDYVQGAVDEAEFHTKASEFAVVPRSIDANGLQREFKFISELLDDTSIDVGDLSMMLGIDPIQTEATIKSLERAS
jgi:hypothetical protein